MKKGIVDYWVLMIIFIVLAIMLGMMWLYGVNWILNIFG